MMIVFYVFQDLLDSIIVRDKKCNLEWESRI